MSGWRRAARSTVTVSCGVTLTPISATAPFTYTQPWAIQSSASRREHRPNSARRLFRRTAPLTLVLALALALAWVLPGPRCAGRGSGWAAATPERTAVAGRATGDERAAENGGRAAGNAVAGRGAAAGLTGGAVTAGRRSTGRAPGAAEVGGAQDVAAAGARPSDEGTAELAGGRGLEEDMALIVTRGLVQAGRSVGNK